MDLQEIISYLERKGIQIKAEKSLFQSNQEMAVMLLTVLMNEVDYLRARVEALEGGASDE